MSGEDRGVGADRWDRDCVGCNVPIAPGLCRNGNRTKFRHSGWSGMRPSGQNTQNRDVLVLRKLKGLRIRKKPGGWKNRSCQTRKTVSVGSCAAWRCGCRSRSVRLKKGRDPDTASCCADADRKAGAIYAVPSGTGLRMDRVFILTTDSIPPHAAGNSNIWQPVPPLGGETYSGTMNRL